MTNDDSKPKFRKVRTPMWLLLDNPSFSCIHSKGFVQQQDFASFESLFTWEKEREQPCIRNWNSLYCENFFFYSLCKKMCYIKRWKDELHKNWINFFLCCKLFSLHKCTLTRDNSHCINAPLYLTISPTRGRTMGGVAMTVFDFLLLSYVSL